MPADTMGVYTPSERSIAVTEAAPLQMAKSLAHELGHHFTGQTDASRAEHETTAEAVAYIVCAHHGLDSGARSFPYIATWSQDPAVFKQALGSIQRVSAQILDRLEQLPPRPPAHAVLYSAPVAPLPEPAAPEPIEPPAMPHPPEGTQFRLF